MNVKIIYCFITLIKEFMFQKLESSVVNSVETRVESKFKK